MPEDQRNFLRRHIIELVVPMLELFWRTVFIWRAGMGGDEETRRKYEVGIPPEEFKPISETVPMMDIFKLMRTPADKNSKENNSRLVVSCVIPEQRGYWEVILSYYLIFFPEIFPDEMTLAKSILGIFPRFKLDPKEDIMNFKPQHLQFLLQLAQNKRRLVYPDNPIEIGIAIHSVMWFSALELKKSMKEEEKMKYLDFLSDQKIKEYEEGGPLNHWEEEWLKIKFKTQEEIENWKKKNRPQKKEEKKEEEKPKEEEKKSKNGKPIPMFE